MAKQMESVIGRVYAFYLWFLPPFFLFLFLFFYYILHRSLPRPPLLLFVPPPPFFNETPPPPPMFTLQRADMFPVTASSLKGLLDAAIRHRR